MKTIKSDWEAPRAVKLSLRETRSDDGGNSDTLGGGIFLMDYPVKPPARKLSISAENKARVLEFLRYISSSAEKLDAAVADPKEAMEKVSLTKDQILITKALLTYLGS